MDGLYSKSDFKVWEQPKISTDSNSMADKFRKWLPDVTHNSEAIKIAIESNCGAHFFKQCNSLQAFNLGVEVGNHLSIRELHLGVYVHECPVQIRSFVEGAYAARADNSCGQTNSLVVYAFKEILPDNRGIKSLALQRFLPNGDPGELRPIEEIIGLFDNGSTVLGQTQESL